VRIVYTKGEIYFGISCFDSESGKIVATQLRRDISQELDDYFEIVIDSSLNRRNAYVFQFNPLGTQRDALITDEQPPQDDASDGDARLGRCVGFRGAHQFVGVDRHRCDSVFDIKLHADERK
jgi:hypothetical protein